MELLLDLTSHCIETEIKREHERAVLSCFKPGADTAAVEKTLTLLQDALTRFDFQRLRSRYPALSGHTDARVVLYSDAEARAGIRIDGAAVE